MWVHRVCFEISLCFVICDGLSFWLWEERNLNNFLLSQYCAPINIMSMPYFSLYKDALFPLQKWEEMSVHIMEWILKQIPPPTALEMQDQMFSKWHHASKKHPESNRTRMTEQTGWREKRDVSDMVVAATLFNSARQYFIVRSGGWILWLRRRKQPFWLYWLSCAGWGGGGRGSQVSECRRDN